MDRTCHELHKALAGATVFRFPFDRKSLPKNGIYLLYEKGETGHDGNRIVRVGTHTGDNNLPPRLHEHFLKENKDRSIFRKNIGRALLTKSKDPFIEEWEHDMTSPKDRARYTKPTNAAKKAEVERQVTEYICGSFHFCLIPVETKEQRLDLETKLIGTVSACPVCKPSAGWLGLSSPKHAIRESGMWNVLGLYAQPLGEQDLQEVASLIE